MKAYKIPDAQWQKVEAMWKQYCAACDWYGKDGAALIEQLTGVAPKNIRFGHDLAFNSETPPDGCRRDRRVGGYVPDLRTKVGRALATAWKDANPPEPGPQTSALRLVLALGLEISPDGSFIAYHHESHGDDRYLTDWTGITEHSLIAAGYEAVEMTPNSAYHGVELRA